MKKLVKFGVLLILLGIIYSYKENILIFLVDKYATISNEIVLKDKNQYYIDYGLSYTSNITNLRASSYDDLLNIYYSIVNSGNNEFSFFCTKEYKSCMSDVLSLAKDEKTLSYINSFVHPYNSFQSIITEYNTLGLIKLQIDKVYDENKISILNNEIDRIINDEIKDVSEPKEVIKIVHDYIINNTKYDIDRADKNIIKYESNTAYGVLIEHYGLCGGYTDAMALFLNRYSIPNFKVVSENHIWNAVYVDGKWYHLDLTWDDPVLTSGDDTLEYTFFLITTEELEDLETNQHIYDKVVFKEVN